MANKTPLLNFSIVSRKIEIVQFASRTRQQFVRLLALVKWAASADRVDKCQVSSFKCTELNGTDEITLLFICLSTTNYS